MKNQTKNVAAAELAVFEVEKMLDITRPDLTERKLDINDKDIYFALINEVKLIIEILLQKKLITKFKLIDLVKHYNKTSNLFALIMIEVDYFSEIGSTKNIDELIKIRDIPRFHLVHSKARREKCDNRINELNVYRITEASELLLNDKTFQFGIRSIESILANCPIGSAYNLAVKKLIPHYRSEIDKFNTNHEIESYLSNIELKKNIILTYTEDGLEFLIHCHGRQKSLKANNTKVNIKITDYSNEDVLNIYSSIIDKKDRYFFLSNCLSEFKNLANTDVYWFLYRELLLHFPKSEKTQQAYDKFVSAFINRTLEDNSYQVIFDIFYKPFEGKNDKVSENLTQHETVLCVITERMKIATIYQLEVSVIQFCYSNNIQIYHSLINSFFSKAPSTINIINLEKELVSIKNFIDNFEAILEFFYSKVNDYILKTVTNFNIYDVNDCLSLTKNREECCYARKALIAKVAENRAK